MVTGKNSAENQLKMLSGEGSISSRGSLISGMREILESWNHA
eukprot:COSAG01_NODE_2943_length_6815_cov_56.357802_8_plen_42_part_00